jgi:putative peptidoglycan lipid II flippase
LETFSVGKPEAAVKSPTGRRSIASSAFVVMFASALSAILGFGREIISAHLYGTRPEMDAFLNASTVPNVLFGVFNGALLAALTPTFSEYIAQGRPEEVRRLGSTVVNALLIAMTALSVVAWFLAPYFVPVVAHGFPPAEQQTVIGMVRVLMPGVIATSIAGVLACALNMNQRFFSASLIYVATNAVTIGVMVALHARLGIYALVFGSVIGLFAQVLILLPAIRRFGLYRFELDWHHPGLSRIWMLLLPVAVGSSGSQINLAFDRYFASTLPSGSTASLGYTTKLAFLPVPIIAGAIATVIAPLVAIHYASMNREGMRKNVSLALRMISFIVIPSATGLCVLAYLIVQTLFQRGAFTPAATAECASFVPFACLPLVATSYSTLLSRACYACKEAKLAVGGSLVTVTINIILSATFLPSLGARGLLLANGVSGFFLTGYLLFVLRRLMGGFDWKPLLSSVMRIALASLVMAACVLALINVHPYQPVTLLSRTAYLSALLLAAAATYIGVALFLRVEELSLAVNGIKRKFSRRMAPAAKS